MAHPSWIRPRTVLYGVLTIVHVFALWLIRPQEPAVFFLWITAAALLVVRMRFRLDNRWLFVDYAVYGTLSLFVETAFLLALMSLVLWLYKGTWWALFLFVPVWLLGDAAALDVLALMTLSAVSGALLNIWERETTALLKDMDTLREKRYDLERERHRLVETQDELSRLSVLAERDRIAEALHDDLGHELSGALLALRAYKTEREEALSHPSFSALESRLTSSVEKLKKTVSDASPEESHGLERLRSLIESFDACPLEYTENGPLNTVSILQWHTLESVLKEAFTNIFKHAKATRVDVQLNVDDVIVRLIVRNDGVSSRSERSGTGLQYMRRRIEAMGGSLSIDKGYRFTLVCVLPHHLSGGQR